MKKLKEGKNKKLDYNNRLYVYILLMVSHSWYASKH